MGEKMFAPIDNCSSEGERHVPLNDTGYQIPYKGPTGYKAGTGRAGVRSQSIRKDNTTILLS